MIGKIFLLFFSLNCNTSNLIMFSLSVFCQLCFWCLLWEVLPSPLSQRFMPMPSSDKCILTALAFSSCFHFEFGSAYGMGCGFNFFSPIFGKTILSHSKVLTSLVKISWPTCKRNLFLKLRVSGMDLYIYPNASVTESWLLHLYSEPALGLNSHTFYLLPGRTDHSLLLLQVGQYTWGIEKGICIFHTVPRK